jgi:hypothetical protein
LHITTAERWVGYARRDWTAYLAARESEQRPAGGRPTVTRSDTKQGEPSARVIRSETRSAGYDEVLNHEAGKTGVRQTRRSTATTLPMMVAPSAMIGEYTGLCGISHLKQRRRT